MIERALIHQARWAGHEVKLLSRDGGSTYLGPTGEPGLILVVLAVSSGGFLARIEDRSESQVWAGEVRRTPEVALASLHRQIKRLTRAGRLKA